MLIKKELLTIPITPPPKADKRSKYTASASVVKLPRSGKILAVEIFKDTLQLRFFSEGTGFILYLPNEKVGKQWKTCKPASALPYTGTFTAPQTTLELVHKFFKKKLPSWHHPYSVLDEINRFAESISGEKSQKAAQKKYELRKKHFAMFPDYPKGLTEFCEKTAFPKSHIFLDKLVKGGRRAVCGACGNEFSVDRSVKHGSAGVCPSCGKAALYHQSWTQQSIEDIIFCPSIREGGHEFCDLMNLMSFKKFVNYFTKQKLQRPGETLKRLVGWYKDYIQMSEEMKIDLSHKSVRYPQDVRKAHDRIVSRYNEVREQIETENLKLATDWLYTAGMKDYVDGNYRIVLPAERKDFIREGQSLNHCVGNQSYFDNHLKGTRMIFFVRRVSAPETPFVTMEVDMKRLRIAQLYGYGDSTAPSEVRRFADKFVRKLGVRSAVA